VNWRGVDAPRNTAVTALRLMLAVALIAALAVVFPDRNLSFSAVSAAGSQHGQSTIRINGLGGVQSNGSDGLKIDLNSTSGRDQVYYANTYQYCCGAAAPTLNIGGTVYGEAGPASGASWTSMTVSNLTGTAAATGATQGLGSGGVRLTYSVTHNSRVYTVIRDVEYTYPNDYFTDTYTITIPSGNTQTVKLYMGGDTAPGSSDSGYGVRVLNPVKTVISLNTSSQIQLGYREVAGSEPFTGAVSGPYSAPYATVRSGGDIGNSVTR